MSPLPGGIHMTWDTNGLSLPTWKIVTEKVIESVPWSVDTQSVFCSDHKWLQAEVKKKKTTSHYISEKDNSTCLKSSNWDQVLAEEGACMVFHKLDTIKKCKRSIPRLSLRATGCTRMRRDYASGSGRVLRKESLPGDTSCWWVYQTPLLSFITLVTRTVLFNPSRSQSKTKRCKQKKRNFKGLGECKGWAVHERGWGQYDQHVLYTRMKMSKKKFN